MKPALFLLFCANKKEADAIREVLLRKHLIACGGTLDDKDGLYWWKGKLESSQNEIILIMESAEEKFQEAEEEIEKIHSHETFVFLSLPISQISQKAKRWLEEYLK